MAKKASMVKASAVPVALVPAPVVPLRLDLGCGPNKKDGFIGVDVRDFPGVDKVVNLTARRQGVSLNGTVNENFGTFAPWPWSDNSIDEIHCSHFIEHLDAEERIHFVNECYRIMKPGAKMMLIAPHWSSCRAYGDLTHKWPPISEFWFYYMSTEWRAANAPHNDFYRCNFDVQWGFAIPNAVQVRNQEYQTFAINHYKDVCQEVQATFTKKV